MCIECPPAPDTGLYAAEVGIAVTPVAGADRRRIIFKIDSAATALYAGPDVMCGLWAVHVLADDVKSLLQLQLFLKALKERRTGCEGCSTKGVTRLVPRTGQKSKQNIFIRSSETVTTRTMVQS